MRDTVFWRRLLLIILLLSPGPALAQIATLIADEVAINADTTIVAEGNVEVLYGTTRLTAERVTYDRAGNTLEIEGPITLIDGASVIIVADAAELDSDLRNGVMRSARLVLEEQLQLAAAEINRVGGRYTQLTNTIASSCQVCAANPRPLWEIRASRVIHDQQERQLYFDNAQLRVAGIPIFYLPRLRLPDPGLRRATGFLIPQIRTTSRLGTGLKLPYFIRIGDRADVTLTPYASTSTTTLEGRYRQVLRRGELSFSGAVSDDDIEPGTRGYLFGEGRFDLPRDFELTFDVELVSDPAYLLEYDYSDKDRLDSEIALARTRNKDRFRVSYTDFRTLRGAELAIADQLPDNLGELSYARRIATSFVGGETWLRLEASSLSRRSGAPILGRDVSRIGASVDWRGDRTFRNGMIGELRAGVTADAYDVSQDPNFAAAPSRITPSVAAALRWPLYKTGAKGGWQVIEPVVQLAWSEIRGDAVPNEDSVLVEFDEGNLFSLSRFSGSDRYETGLRANLGVNWTRSGANGWTQAVTLGRVVRFSDPAQFTSGTGLDGDVSDWLAVLRLRYGNRLSLTSRGLFDDAFAFTKSETRLAWQNDRAAVSSSYLWMVPEPAENRLTQLSEWAVDGGYRFNRNWTGKADWRYDFEAGRAATAGLGLEYRNECIAVSLSLSRRFTSSTSVDPTTDFAIRVALAGFGAGNDGRSYRRGCIN